VVIEIPAPSYHPRYHRKSPHVPDYEGPQTKAPYRLTIDRTDEDDPARSAAIEEALKRIREKRHQHGN
jgi:hypothetical protein